MNDKYSTVHDRISKIIARSNNNFKNLSLDSFKSFFERISQDEAEHQKLLSDIEDLIGATENSLTEVTLEVNMLSPELSQKNLSLIGSSTNQKMLK